MNQTISHCLQSAMNVFDSLLLSMLTMPAKMVNFTRKLYDEIEDLAQKEYKGNFSQAMRIKLGEKPERDDIVLRTI